MPEEGSRIGTERGSSPASRGPAGAYIEGELGALYLLAMLTGNRAPGMPDARVVRVRFQGTEQGFALDDLIISGTESAGDTILEIQSKRDITFSPGDGVYGDVAAQLARSVVGAVPEHRHLLGIATQRISRKISGAYQDVLRWARMADDAAAFFSRLGARGIASKDMRDFVETTRRRVVAGGVADDDDAIWRLLRRLLILEFDFEATAPISRAYGLALARMALADEDVGFAESLWSRLVDLSIKTGTTGGEINRKGVRANVAQAGIHLVGDRDYGPARARLAELARNTLAHIGTSVAGVTLPRPEAVAAVDEATEAHRFVELRGDAGVGKSWILRHLAERVARRAPVVVLDREATPSGGWLQFSHHLGIPGSAVEFLTDLAASGGATLFVDGIDMFDDGGRQRTIAELIRAASAVPGFRVIATTRTTGDTEPWLDDRIVAEIGGAHAVRIGALSESEVAALTDQAPDLRSLLDPTHPAAGLARNLYRLSRLLRVPSAAGIRTEAELAGLWWRSGDCGPSADVRAAQRLMAALAARALKGERELELVDDSAARSHLIGTSTLRETRRDRVDFHHDVLRDWAIGSYVVEDTGRLDALDMSVPVSPRVARGIEFAARLALEPAADCSVWIRLLDRLSGHSAHGSWRRQAILALTRSEAGLQLLGRCSSELLADRAALLVELCTAIVAVETVATADLITMPAGGEGDLLRSHRTDVTGAAILVLRWVTAQVTRIPSPAIGAVVELVNTQLVLLKHIRSFARDVVAMLFRWLRQLDGGGAEGGTPGARGVFGSTSEARRGVVERLRQTALLLGEFAPDQLKAYLTEVAGERDSRKVDAIRQFSKTIAPVAPAELADLTLASLLPKKERRGRGDRLMERAFTFADTSYLPPSPAQPPLLDLLECAPVQGLRLIRTLVAEAVAFDTDGRSPEGDGFTVDFGRGPRFFPWTYTYLWSRDQARDHVAASGLKALEAWGQQRLDDGEPVDHVIADVLGPEGGCAAYVLVAIDVLLSHFGASRDALAPFVAVPGLLAADHVRRSHDLIGGGMDRLSTEKEPGGKVTLADLRARPSRRACLLDTVPHYLDQDPVADRLRVRLGTAVAGLEPILPHSDWSDARFIARSANNMLQRSNWADVGDGRIVYRPPTDEAVHLEEMERRRVAFMRSADIEARISLAMDGGNEHADSATARDAIAHAGGALPDDRDDDVVDSRSTRLISTALLAARDGDDALLAREEAWVRRVIAIALEGRSDRRGRSEGMLRHNRPAIAILALIHLWARAGRAADRNALIRHATRDDHSAAPAFSMGLPRILEVEPRLLKAAMRAAFASMTQRWDRSDEEPSAESERFDADRAAAVDRAVAAEVVWLDGGAEPAWPVWPGERPNLKRGAHVWASRPTETEDLGKEVTNAPVRAERPLIVRVDSGSAARWLEMLQAPSVGGSGWRQDVVEAYVGWTAQMNGLGLPVDAEVDRGPRNWNSHFYALFAERLLDATDAAFLDDLRLVTELPDVSFGEVAQTVAHSADVLYFNDPQRPPARPADLRARLALRVTELRRWRTADDPAGSRIDMESGGVIANTMLNTYDPFNGTHSYLLPALFDRVDPLLPAMRPLLSGGPTSFVALCIMNLLLVSPRPRHLYFLLEATEAWFARTRAPALWIDLGIGRKVVRWLEAAIVQDPGLLTTAHPSRSRIDRILGSLVGVGVAEAHEVELRVEDASAKHDQGARGVRDE